MRVKTTRSIWKCVSRRQIKLANATVGRSRSTPAWLGFVALLLAVQSIGCASMSLPAGKLFGKAEAATPAAEPFGQCTVLMKPGFGKGTQSTLDISEDTTVQSVLERAGVQKKFKSMDIMIYRDIEGAMVPLKMAVDYNVGKRSVVDSQNYRVLPGDKVLFSEKSNSAISKALKNVAGIEM